MRFVNTHLHTHTHTHTHTHVVGGRNKVGRERTNIHLYLYSSTLSVLQIQWEKHPSHNKVLEIWILFQLFYSGILCLRLSSLSTALFFFQLYGITLFSTQIIPQQALTFKRSTDIMSLSSYYSFCLIIFTTNLE